MKIILFCYCLLLRELFSYSVAWCGIMLEATARSLYLTTQHYRKNILEEEDNNMLSTYIPILDIKENTLKLSMIIITTKCMM